MRPATYIAAITELLISSAVIKEFSVRRERITAADGYIRARLELVDGTWLEFSEYVQRRAEGEIEVITYSYHWADSGGRLIRRWDNTPHFPNISGFPHHVHDGASDEVYGGRAVSLFVVLAIISGELFDPSSSQ